MTLMLHWNEIFISNIMFSYPTDNARGSMTKPWSPAVSSWAAPVLLCLQNPADSAAGPDHPPVVLTRTSQHVLLITTQSYPELGPARLLHCSSGPTCWTLPARRRSRRWCWWSRCYVFCQLREMWGVRVTPWLTCYKHCSCLPPSYHLDHSLACPAEPWQRTQTRNQKVCNSYLHCGGTEDDSWCWKVSVLLPGLLS